MLADSVYILKSHAYKVLSGLPCVNCYTFLEMVTMESVILKLSAHSPSTLTVDTYPSIFKAIYNLICLSVSMVVPHFGQSFL